MKARKYSIIVVTLMMSITFALKQRCYLSLLSRTRVLSSMLSAMTSSGLTSTEKLAKLRDSMQKEGIDAFIIPTDDPHMSEYTAPVFDRRKYISGFTGSAGTAVVTRSNAYLWTDGRYHTQAEQELDHNWELMRSGLKDVPSPAEFLASNLSSGAVIGIDPYLHAAGTLKKVVETLTPAKITIKSLKINILDPIWESEATRPAMPTGSIRIHPIEYAGRSVSEKLIELRKQMVKSSAKAVVLTALDEVAWMFNIRGQDVPCNPVTIAYALITADEAVLFIDSRKVTDDVKLHLSAHNVSVRNYEEALGAVESVAKSIGVPGEASELKYVWLDDKTANQALVSVVPLATRLLKPTPVVLAKAVKNPSEIACMIACHRRDGAAMAEFMAELEEQLAAGATFTEVEIDEKATAWRKAQKGFVDLSFPTIAGVGSNGAIIHYRAEPGVCKTLTANDLMLLDSGAQYEDGTTDVTRTIHTGSPTDYQKEMFTRVLKGNIGVDSAVFPAGTPGCLLDSYARMHLWAIGEDFGHGTGHGVGSALNVHEGPHSISRVLNPQPLLPGMIVSNEPGFYLPGDFGIRIENLLLVVERTDMKHFGGRGFLGFEKLTLIPIQKKLMDVKLFTSVEVDWINAYHARVWEEVSPLLTTERARAWLRTSTSPL